MYLLFLWQKETTEHPWVQLTKQRAFAQEQVLFQSVPVTLQAEDKKRKETGCCPVVLGCNILNLNFVSVSKVKINTVYLDCKVNTAALGAVQKDIVKTKRLALQKPPLVG